MLEAGQQAEHIGRSFREGYDFGARGDGAGIVLSGEIHDDDVGAGSPAGIDLGDPAVAEDDNDFRARHAMSDLGGAGTDHGSNRQASSLSQAEFMDIRGTGEPIADKPLGGTGRRKAEARSCIAWSRT
ncbi:MAG: hypothetical protein J5J06_02885 [Phycisphaerae bacterium]|nr:hypothetical protein [Phycisphaerae bacterium]